jgi:hypothetical protein
MSPDDTQTPMTADAARRDRPSPLAAGELQELIDDGDWQDADEAMGATDCPHGCQVEPDGACAHGYQSAGLTLGVI